jgi:lipoprotein-anchoring transpeptidase ErfK/SrfK
MSVLSLLVLTGCHAGPTAEASTAAAPPAAPAAPTAGAPMIAVSPQPGATDVAPNTAVTVTANSGELGEIRVTDADGHELAGAMDANSSRWHATGPVRADAVYSVDAWGTGPDGKPIEATSEFRTKGVKHSSTLQVASISPNDGAKVGVAQPLVVAFDQPVADRKVVQNALQVTTSPNVTGAWYWIDGTHVDYRPQHFWPANTKVTLNAQLSGIVVGGGAVGGKDRTSSFTVGRSQVIRVNANKHQLSVYQGNHKVKTYDVSTGKPGWLTRSGTEVMMDKVGHKHWTNQQIDAKEDYSLYSKYAIRITNSGEFVHDAPWSSGSIGDANTSHGCVGLKTKDMKWIWDHSLVGDPVVVSATGRDGQDLTNRYDDWNVPWSKWSKGNAG